ncbi:hypothetical protein BpHYR1_049984 [Brachionus plicatilis]|uniref:Uncharacterized protein n=1 Tax=Brachionus plicatilis TaxID=10195 RepID=A0A3M7Q294_BRAPC|nr:hypothetical protein BpHYR1_049984 [Brachionus plicatilis]
MNLSCKKKISISMPCPKCENYKHCSICFVSNISYVCNKTKIFFLVLVLSMVTDIDSQVMQILSVSKINRQNDQLALNLYN